jgi:hypothetical protein
LRVLATPLKPRPYTLNPRPGARDCRVLATAAAGLCTLLATLKGA